MKAAFSACHCFIRRIVRFNFNCRFNCSLTMASPPPPEDAPLYPEIEPFFTGNLKVSDVHTIYYEQVGNPKGIPVVFLHGGPGGDTSARDRRFFDPKAYHVILFHQRGAGKSSPAYCLLENDTWSLVQDMEDLRNALGVDKWVIFGGSWGSTLALAYAQTHISRVLGMVIRGIFTGRQEEQDWVYGEKKGAALVFPAEYQKFIAPIPLEERDNLVKAYHKRVTSADEKEKLHCATVWNAWELVLSAMKVTEKEVAEKVQDQRWNLAHARMECHYFINNCFFTKKDQLIEDAGIIADAKIPVEIVQGRYDMVCPVTTAYALHQRLPESNLHILPMSGHSAKDLEMTKKLVEIMDKLKMSLKM